MNPIDSLARVDRLSSLDSGFLSLESPTTPMHIGSITWLDSECLRDGHGRIRLDDLRELVEERLALIPRFRQRPIDGPFSLGRPVWADDPDFDVANHVNEIVLPVPGSEAQLRELCAHLMVRTLDRSRPLWELWVVDGYEDGDVVLIEKIHHVMMDGVSGVDVAMLLTDPSAEIGRLPAEHSTPTGHPAAGALLAGGILDEFGIPLSLLTFPLLVAKRLGGAALHRSDRVTLTKEISQLGRGALSLLNPATVTPRSSLNEPIGRRRSYDHAELSLSAMRRIAKAFDCTLNDVALAAVTGGVRRLLLKRGEDTAKRFQVAVPVSTRQAAEHAMLGNRVAVFLVPLPVDCSDELGQLTAIRQTTRERKDAGQAVAVAGLVHAADRLPAPVIDLLAHLTHRQPFANAVVTNVPGPSNPRYLLGSRIRRIAPIVPLAGNLDFSIGIFSYDEEISFGCFADSDRCPDLHLLIEGIRASVEVLGDLANGGTLP